MLGWFVLGLFAGALLALLLYRWAVGRRKPGYRALCEYWVYTDQAKLPDTTVLMDRMIRGNPYNKPGRPCIGAREGMLFSDIRLHMAVALRQKNVHAFRPDLFSEGLEPTAELLQTLGAVGGLVKVRYLSEVELRDDRHLQFMPHLAGAMLDLTEGVAVYDPVMESLWSAEEFRALLSASTVASRPSMHVRTLWQEDGPSAWAETRGLAKVGLAELRTDYVEKDLRVLALHLLEQAAGRALRQMQTPTTLELDEYGDTFLLNFRRTPTETRVAIQRLVRAS